MKSLAGVLACKDGISATIAVNESTSERRLICFIGFGVKTSHFNKPEFLETIPLRKKAPC